MSTEQQSLIESLGGLRTDLRRWRRIVSRCVESQDKLAARKLEPQYYVVHGRITRRCRRLSEHTSAEDERRAILQQVEDLVRPWVNTEAVQEAPRPLVAEVLTQGQQLETALANKGTQTWTRVRKQLAIAVVAILLGIMAVLVGIWWTGGGSTWFNQAGYRTAQWIREMSLVEQFGLAAVAAWLAGTWMLTRVFKS